MAYRDLERVRTIISDATGLEVAYVYDDLVFPDHTAFIIKFDDTNENRYFCYFHKDCRGTEQKKLFSSLQNSFHEHRCLLLSSGVFDLEQKENEIEIKFS